LLSPDEIQSMLVERVGRKRLAAGMVVGITEAKERAFVAHGVAKSRSGAPLHEDSIFEIGSVTKLITALALADMTRRRETDPDEPVAELLPTGTRVPARNGREITLRDLATHKSGLPRRPGNLEPHDPKDPYAGYTAEHLYTFLGQHELTRTPGDLATYSNIGYGLLGHALALRAGFNDYESLVRARILDPLGMMDTTISLPPDREHRLASPHDSSLDLVPLWNLGILAGAGAFRSTATDLLTFLEAIGDTDSPVSAMLPHLVTLHLGSVIEFVPPGHNIPAIASHSGGTGGTRTFVRCEGNRGVVVLGNAGIDAVIDLGQHILDRRRLPQWFRQEVAVNPMVFAALVGRFQIGPDSVLDITVANDRLLARLSGQEALQIFPMSDTQYFYKAVNAQLTFELGANGRAVRVILHQNAMDQIAERIL
jgi:CubicO group peptidase (beta-lactamase class C family)